MTHAILQHFEAILAHNCDEWIQCRLYCFTYHISSVPL